MKTQEELDLAMIKENGWALQLVKDQTPKICVSAVQQNGRILQYVKEQTPEICMAAVEQDGLALQFVKEQTLKICMAAVEQDGYALQYVKEQTPEICLTAVHQNYYALKFVKNQTPEICLAAVRQRSRALEYVKEQTPEICFAAVRKDGYALQYVKKQTIEICLVAVHQNGWALQYVKEQTFELVMMVIEDIDEESEDEVLSIISKKDLMNELSRLEYSPNKMYQLHDILNLERNSVHLDVSGYDVIFQEKKLQSSVCTILNEEQHIINLLIENDDLTNDNIIDLIKKANKWNYISTKHNLKEYINTKVNIFLQDKCNKEIVQYVSTNIPNDEYIYINNSNVVLIDVDPMDLLLFRNEIFQEEEL